VLAFSPLTLYCSYCGTQAALTVAGTDRVQSNWDCPECRKINLVELPGRVIWSRGLLAPDDAARQLRRLEESDEAVRRAIENLDRAAREAEQRRLAAGTASEISDPLSARQMVEKTCAECGQTVLIAFQAGPFPTMWSCPYPGCTGGPYRFGHTSGGCDTLLPGDATA
jgi:hypothetical protein